MRPSLLIPLLLGLVTAPAGAQAPASLDAPMMMPGDQLEVVVYRNADFSGLYRITAQGTLLHPLFEHVQVAGVPIEEARRRMATELRNHLEEPLFTFEPRYRVYVGGLVRVQGEHFFPEMTVGEAIVLAGGSTSPDRRTRVRLIRGSEISVANLEGGRETALLQTRIRSGDQILVEDRPSFTRTFLSPTMQVIQTVTALVATYVYFDAIFGS